MKTINTAIMIAALVMAPMLSKAQWSAVRFDSANIFRNIYAVNPNDVFSIGTDPNFGEYFLLRTADGGTNWDSIGLNTAIDEYQVYELFFADANNGFIGGRRNNATQNMQKTVDNGTTWTDITPDPSNIETISGIYFLDAQQGWATSGQNLYITVNGGTAWTTVDMNFIPQDIYFLNTLVGYAAGGDTMSSPALVMKTIDGGLTWNPILTNTDWNVFVNTNNNLNIVDANTLFVSQDYTNKLFRTLDGGITWDTIVCDSAMQITDFHFESADSGQVLTSMGQLFYTNDAGATWNLAYATAWGFYGPSVYLYSLSFSGGIGYVCGSSGLIKRFDQNLNGTGENEMMSATMGIFPNPCYGYRGICLKTTGISGKCTVQIMNSVGQLVMQSSVNVVDGSPVQFYTGDLATGNYTITLSNDTQVRTAKLVKAN